MPRLRLAIVKRSDVVKGFVVLPRRWVVERTFSWFGRNRRLAKDFENLAGGERLLSNRSAAKARRRRGALCEEAHTQHQRFRITTSFVVKGRSHIARSSNHGMGDHSLRLTRRARSQPEGCPNRRSEHTLSQALSSMPLERTSQARAGTGPASASYRPMPSAAFCGWK